MSELQLQLQQLPSASRISHSDSPSLSSIDTSFASCLQSLPPPAVDDGDQKSVPVSLSLSFAISSQTGTTSASTVSSKSMETRASTGGTSESSSSSASSRGRGWRRLHRRLCDDGSGRLHGRSSSAASRRRRSSQSRSRSRSSSRLRKQTDSSSGGEPQSIRHVRFCKDLEQVQFIKHVRDMSDEEKDSIWLTEEEQRNIRFDIMDIIDEVASTGSRLTNASLSSTLLRSSRRDMLRGLEPHIPEICRVRRRMIYDAQDAVLEEQTIQKGSHYYDVYAIAALYSRYSHSAQEAAQLTGIRDAMAARDVSGRSSRRSRSGRTKRTTTTDNRSSLRRRQYALSHASSASSLSSRSGSAQRQSHVRRLRVSSRSQVAASVSSATGSSMLSPEQKRRRRFSSSGKLAPSPGNARTVPPTARPQSRRSSAASQGLGDTVEALTRSPSKMRSVRSLPSTGCDTHRRRTRRQRSISSSLFETPSDADDTPGLGTTTLS